MSARRMMRSRGVHESPTREQIGPARWVDGWRTVASDVPCKADPLSLADQTLGDTAHGVLGYRLFVPIDTPIARGHRFTVDDTLVLIVRSIEPPGGRPFGPAGGQIRCICEEEQLAVTTEATGS